MQSDIADTKTAELRYTASMVRELRDMAMSRRDQMLTYLLELAYLEAADRLRGIADTAPAGKARDAA